MKKPFRLSRRAALRGAGIAVGLPLLEAMVGPKGGWIGTAFAQQAAPVRVMAFHFPHGASMSAWRPAQVGTGWTASQILKPLEPHRDYINVISGLDQVAGFKGRGGQHAQGMPACATASAGGQNGALGPSFDQVLAQEFGGDTKFRSLVANNELAGPHAEQATTAHMNNIAWGENQQPVEGTRRSVSAFYAKLVTGGLPTGSAPAAGASPEASALLARKQSALDHVMAEIGTLNRKVSSIDKARLDEHLTSVREVERMLDQAGGGGGASCVDNGDPGDIADPEQRALAFGKLFALAFACDLTRYASFAMTNGYDDLHYTKWEYNGKGYHLRTHENVSDTLNATMGTYFHNIFASFLAELKSIPEGSGNLLDNSLIYFGSENSSGYHTFANMPVVVAGKGGGKVMTGRHLAFPGLPLGRLFLSMLKIAGSKRPAIGDGGTTPLPDFW